MDRKYYTAEQILDALSEVGVGAGDISEVMSCLGRMPSAEPTRCQHCKYFTIVKNQIVEEVKSAESEWNNHTVACLLAELFDDTCACNYCDIDEWLPEKCEVIDACPNPVGVACWEQFLTHRKERG